MSRKTWEELEQEGWERRVSSTTNRVSYRTPVVAGRRKTVSRRRDITEEQNNDFGDILFPSRKKAKQEKASDEQSDKVRDKDKEEDVVEGEEEQQEPEETEPEAAKVDHNKELKVMTDTL